jgi:hypothetical protein
LKNNRLHEDQGNTLVGRALAAIRPGREKTESTNLCRITPTNFIALPLCAIPGYEIFSLINKLTVK